MDASVAQALMDTLTALDDELTAAQATVDRLLLERQGVETALRRFGYTSPSGPATSGPATGPATDKEALQSDVRPEQTDTALTSRVLDMLRTAGVPTRVAEIAESLNLDITQVRSAVAYLHRKHRVHNPRRGFWQAIIDTETVPASRETVSAAALLPRQKVNDARGTGFEFDRAPWHVHDHRTPVGG